MISQRNLKKESVNRLATANKDGKLRATIYMPTHRTASPPHMSEDEIRFKNLRNKLDKLMSNRSIPKATEQFFSERLAELNNNTRFWERQTNGLLICMDDENFNIFHMPLETEEYVAIDNFYHLAPALAIMNDAIEYYVLIVRQNNPVLLKGDFYGVREAKTRLPKNLQIALNIDEMNQKSEQQRSAAGANDRTGGFNGRGGSKSPVENDKLRFMQLLDRLISKEVKPTDLLILAGVSSDVSEFRQTTHQKNTADSVIELDLHENNLEEVHNQAMDIIRKEIINPSHDNVIREYKNLNGTNSNLTAFDFKTIKEAAEKGRIDKLLIPAIRYTSDTVQDDLKPVPVAVFPEDGLARQYNLMARDAHNTSAKIFAIEEKHMPYKKSLALATLRY